MFCLKLSEANIEIRRKNRSGSIQKKYDLPDHLPVGLNFFVLSVN
jgi:hypothetical protein